MVGFKKSFDSLKRTRRPSPRNIALLVKNYNIESEDPNEHFVVGVDVERNEDVKIYLKPLESELTSGHQRPGFADYADPSSSMHVNAESEGLKPGVLMLDNCEMASKGTYKANWIHALIHDSAKTKENLEIGFSSVFLIPGRYDESQPERELYNQAFVRQAMNKDSKMFAANQADELLAAIQQAMVQPENTGRYRPEAMVRVVDYTDEDPFVESVILTAPYKPAEGDEINELYSPQECMEIFLSRQKDEEGNDKTRARFSVLQSIVESMRSSDPMPTDEIFLEVIPIQRRNFGPENKKDFFALKEVDGSHGKKTVNALTPKGEVMLNRYLRRVEGEETERLWTPTIVGTAKPTISVSEKGVVSEALADYQFVTKANTNDVFPRGYTQSHIPTNHYANESELKKVFVGSKPTATKAAVKDSTNSQQVTSEAKPPATKPTAQKSPPKEQVTTTPKPKAAKPDTPAPKPEATPTPVTDDLALEDELFADIAHELGGNNEPQYTQDPDAYMGDELEDELFNDIADQLSQTPTSNMGM